MAIKTTIKLLAALSIVSVVLLQFEMTFAASQYLAPASGSYKVGQNFSATVYVSSNEQAMNAASGSISFTSDTIEVTSLNTGGSIFNLWVREPSFNNESGTIRFEGVVLNPGYTGKGGKILTINFRAKKAGTAKASYAQGAILANDGLGTSIVDGLGGASFTITDGAPQPEPEPKDEKPQEKPKVEEPKEEVPAETIPETITEVQPLHGVAGFALGNLELYLLIIILLLAIIVLLLTGMAWHHVRSCCPLLARERLNRVSFAQAVWGAILKKIAKSGYAVARWADSQQRPAMAKTRRSGTKIRKQSSRGKKKSARRK